MAVAQGIAIEGIDITTYLVKDVPRAKKFWSETMGLKITQDYEDSGAEFTFDDGTTFGLWKMSDGTWEPGSGVFFRVSDIKAAVDYYKSKGVKFEEQVFESPVCHMAFAEDSEGNHFILHQHKT